METAEIQPLTRKSVAQLLLGREGSSATNDANCRRRNLRWPFPGTVELWVPETDGEDRYILATCVNLSLDGVGILCDEEFPPGFELAIAIHQPEVSFHGRAVVRHATRNDSGYFIGVQFCFDEPARRGRGRAAG